MVKIWTYEYVRTVRWPGVMTRLISLNNVLLWWHIMPWQMIVTLPLRHTSLQFKEFNYVGSLWLISRLIISNPWMRTQVLIQIIISLSPAIVRCLAVAANSSAFSYFALLPKLVSLKKVYDLDLSGFQRMRPRIFQADLTTTTWSIRAPTGDGWSAGRDCNG